MQSAECKMQNEDQTIREIWAWIVRSEDGSEAVAAVAGSREKLENKVVAARQAAATLGATIHACRFIREDCNAERR